MITVVVPTRDRLAQLEHTVRTLARQTSSDFEVVIVDNGSTDGTADRVTRLASDLAVPLRLVHERTTGVSAARNAGVREAAGDRVLFLNDDTAPSHDDLIERHAAALAEVGPAGAVMGRVRYREDQLRDPFMRFLDEHAQFTYEDLRAGVVDRPGRVYTAHLSLHRAAFDRAGGFDVRLRFGFEDAEFAHRFLRAGGSVAYRDDLVTVHDHPMTLREWARRAERMGAAGSLVNRISDAQPPLAQIPSGPYWTALRSGARLVEAVPAPYGRLPPRVRRAAYVVLNQGAYTRGYRRAGPAC